MPMTFRAIAAALMLTAAPAAFAQAPSTTHWPNQKEGDFVIVDFRFKSGETLPALNIHYTTLGTPLRNASGEVSNAVILLHGTSSSGKAWLMPSLADELFGPGQALDAGRYFIVLPDGIGRGGSSKPSDGLKGNFPHYRYADIVESEYRLITEGLGIKHLRLVMGSSMGGMHTFMWGYTYPNLMDGLIPIASQPIEISGRNWVQRRIAAEAIRQDPGWHNGFYDQNPTQWTVTAPYGFLQTENVLQLQKMFPTREAGDEMYRKLQDEAKRRDANDTLWGIEAVMDYNPRPHLDKITARLMAINSADDEANPPQLASTRREIERIPNAKYVLIPASEETHGHYTHLRAAFWKAYVAEFLKELPAQM
jgi:homoserine O-acetyltransferase/O-succinyltransferase